MKLSERKTTKGALSQKGEGISNMLMYDYGGGREGWPSDDISNVSFFTK